MRRVARGTIARIFAAEAAHRDWARSLQDQLVVAEMDKAGDSDCRMCVSLAARGHSVAFASSFFLAGGWHSCVGSRAPRTTTAVSAELPPVFGASAQMFHASCHLDFLAQDFGKLCVEAAVAMVRTQGSQSSALREKSTPPPRQMFFLVFATGSRERLLVECVVLSSSWPPYIEF